MAVDKEVDSYWNSTKSRGFSFGEDDSSDTGHPFSARYQPPKASGEPSKQHSKPSKKTSIKEKLCFPESRRSPIPASDESCTVCQRNISTSNFRCEGHLVFCTEKCWQDTIRDTVLALTTKRPSNRYSIEMFKSIESRALLLSQATQTKNGNLIFEILQHLNSVLSKHSFRSLLFDNQTAMNHYVRFLKQTGQIKKATELLRAQGLIYDANIIKHRDLMSNVVARADKNPKHSVRVLNEFAKEELDGDPLSSQQHNMVVQHSQLLEEQIALENKFRSSESSGGLQFQLPGSFINLTLCETIHYLVLLHASADTGSPADKLRVKFRMPENQYRWVVVEPLCMLRNWKELDSIMINQKWLSRKVETHLSSSRLVLLLRTFDTPADVIIKYLGLVSDQQELVNLSLRLKIYSVAIKSFVKKRDCSGLKELAKEIPESSQDFHIVKKYLNTPTNKWQE